MCCRHGHQAQSARWALGVLARGRVVPWPCAQQVCAPPMVGGGGAVPDRPSQPRRRARSLGRAEGPSERVLLGEGPSADWRLSWRPASVCSSLLRCRFLREGTVFSINVSSGTLQNGAQRAAPDLCLIWPLRCLERHLH